MSCSAFDPTALLGSASCLVLADTDAVSAWVDSVVTSNERVSVMAVGRYETNQAVRTQLLALGVERERMTFRTYWKPGRVGRE